MSRQLFSESARIDIATNFASFDAIDFSEDFGDFLSGTFDARHLLTLVHEATHHWCLTTPVGTALAARTLGTYHDAAYAAVAAQAGRPVSGARAQNLDSSLLVSRIITAFFVPLLEGLALYAEWRACPAVDGTYSRPFDIYARFSGSLSADGAEKAFYRDLASQLTGKPPAEQDELLRQWVHSDEGRSVDSDVVGRIQLELQCLRTRPSERRRLHQALSSPIDPRCGSYQLGYLFVCALESLCDAHQNTDMMLGFLRDYFFNDYALAALILDESVEHYDLYTRVRRSLQSRVDALVRDPPAAAAKLRDWGAAVAEAPILKTTADDFLGRPSSGGATCEAPSEPAPAELDTYSARLETFCAGFASSLITPNELRTFLIAGRVLMPLGSKDFVVTAIDGDRRELTAPDGTVLSIPTGNFTHRPEVGDEVSVSMLVNVAALGTAVSIRWGERFEVVPLLEDTISKKAIQQVYHAAATIRVVVTAGQEVISQLHRSDEHGTEPLEQAADSLMATDNATLDIVQVYRGAIVGAFAAERPDVVTPEWRKRVFAAFEPSGIATLLGDEAVLQQFLSACGMPVGLVLDADRLSAAGLVDLEVDAGKVIDEWFLAVNGVSRTDHQAALAAAKERFEQYGLEIIVQTTSGDLVSLI